MILVAVRGLLGRKVRAFLTAIAVVLGVAMISGTYVLTDTIKEAFDAIFTESYRGTDAVVTARTAFDPTAEGETGFVQETLPESMLERVRRVDGVSAALGGVAGPAQIIGRDGKVITTTGAPSLGFSVDPEQPQFESLTLVRGGWPAEGGVVIDETSFDKAKFRLGEKIAIAANGPIERLTLTGVVKFGAVSSIGGATLAGFRLKTAQRLFGKEGRLDQIRVAADQGVTQQQLLSNLQRELGNAVRIRSVEAQADRDASGTNQFIGFLQNFLLAFGGIALFVGAFVIANTLSITIAQRTREFATIRTIGGSRRQVLTSVIVEALAIGIFASVTGLFLGFLLARGLNALFDAVGFDLPKVGLVYAPRTIVVSLLVGIVITLLASLRPAIRATRVPPIAAVREGATLPESRYARWRPLGALLLAGLGLALLLFGLFVDALDTREILISLGLGALLVFFGVALFASRIVRPLSTGVSPVATASVSALSVLFYPVLLALWLVRLGLAWVLRAVGRAGERPERPGVLTDAASRMLARENAQRNPQRTASTAAALMIGLAVVTLVAVLSYGIRSTFIDSVDKQFIADYAITAQNNFTPLPIDVERAAEQVAGVTAVSGIRNGQAHYFGKVRFVAGVDEDVAKTITIDWVDGSNRTPETMGRNGAIVRDTFAKDHNLDVGSPIKLLVPSGKRIRVVVRGIFDEPTGGSPFSDVNISQRLFDADYEQPTNSFTFLDMAGGVTPVNTARLERSLADFPNAKLQDREEFKDNQISGLTSILNVLYVLLALSVIVSLFGIINTLALSVFERTRELGLLRAIGMTRRQVRRMVRQESVVTALIGAVLGILLGIGLGALLVARIDFIEFALPVTTLIVIAIAAVFVGILAAILPARRASRLNVLEALQYE